MDEGSVDGRRNQLISHVVPKSRSCGVLSFMTTADPPKYVGARKRGRLALKFAPGEQPLRGGHYAARRRRQLLGAQRRAYTYYAIRRV